MPSSLQVKGAELQLEPQLLIRQIRKGDRAAFRQLMETYQDGLFRLAFSFTRNMNCQVKKGSGGC